MSRHRGLLVVAVIATVALAGCASGGGGTTTAPSAETTPGSPAGTTADDTPTPADTTTPTPTGPEVAASAAEIKSGALTATRQVSAYEVTVNGTFYVTANNVEQTIGVDNYLAIDRAATEYRRSLTQTARGRTVTVEGYLVDDTNYVKSTRNVQQYGSKWIKANVSGNATALFERYDVLEKYRQALGNSTVSVAGATRADGAVLRKLRADPNETALGKTLRIGNRTTITDAHITYWIDRDGAIQRVNATMAQTVETQFGSTNRTVVVTLAFEYGSAPIELPAAADSAVDVTNQTTLGTGSGNEGTAEESDDAADDSNGTDAGIDVKNGDLAVEPDRAFQRVEAVLGTNVTDPKAVVVEGPANLTRGDGDSGPRTLSSIVGLESPSLAGTNVTLGGHEVPLAWLAEGRVDGLGNVYLHNAPGMSADVARMLTVHEFVHYVQLQNDRFAPVNSAIDATTDGTYARKATTEGAAVFTTDAVLERYAPDGPRNTELYDGIAAAVPDGSAREWANSWYRFGERYVASRIDDPAAIEAVYENPPRTSEQVLHRLEPGTEPPVPLDVSVETGSEYVLAGSDRKGEAYIRYVLANGVSTDRAARAAAGWGNDTVRTLRPADGEGNTSYVWVHRWDDRENASEFADAVRDYFEAFGTTENGTTTLNGAPVTFERLNDRTTVLVIGPLQDSVTLSADGERVVVETP